MSLVIFERSFIERLSNSLGRKISPTDFIDEEIDFTPHERRLFVFRYNSRGDQTCYSFMDPALTSSVQHFWRQTARFVSTRLRLL